MSFQHIIGNEKIKDLLTTTLSHQCVLHSYMFVGPDGIGKFLFAKEFAKSILCSSTSHTEACDSCKSCISFLSDNHPDFLVIDSEDGKSIKIEQIRYLQEKISEKPITSSQKVYIINNSDLMTREAQNCLLKTLEEPPIYAIIILILSNENKLLNTIKSRCTKVSFQPLTNEEMIKYFHTINPEYQLTQSILDVCQGSIGKALKVQNEFELYKQVDTILENMEKEDIVDVWNSSEVLYKNKDNIYDLLEYMNVILVTKLTKSNLIKYANCITSVETIKSRLLTNANYDMSIDYLLMNMWEELNEKNSRN